MDTATGVDADGSVRDGGAGVHEDNTHTRSVSVSPGLPLALTPSPLFRPLFHFFTQKTYASPAELWREVEADLEGGWYAKAVQYWDAQPATDDGVLGGHADAVAGADVAQSEAFLLKVVGPARLEAAAAGKLALAAADCGAGVGRVSKDLLLRFFAHVDLVEPSAHLLASARARLGEAVAAGGAGGGRAGARLVGQPRAFLQCGLQAWNPAPATYDVVWVQWALLYLTDGEMREIERDEREEMRTGEGGGARLGRDGVRGGTGFISLSLSSQPFPLPSPHTLPHPTPLHSRRHRLPAPGRRRPQARRRPGRQGKRGGRRLCGRPGRPLPHPLPPLHAGPGPGGGPGGGGGRPPARLSGGPIWGAHVRVAGWGAGGRVKGECVCACVVGVCQESAAPHLRNGGGALPPPPPPRPIALAAPHPTRSATLLYAARPLAWHTRTRHGGRPGPRPGRPGGPAAAGVDG